MCFIPELLNCCFQGCEGKGGVGVGRREGKRSERRGERGTGHYVMTKGQTLGPLQAIGLRCFFLLSFFFFFPFFFLSFCVCVCVISLPHRSLSYSGVALPKVRGELPRKAACGGRGARGAGGESTEPRERGWQRGCHTSGGSGPEGRGLPGKRRGRRRSLGVKRGRADVRDWGVSGGSGCKPRNGELGFS